MEHAATIFGWLMLVVLGVGFGASGLILFVVSQAFSGRPSFECLIPTVIGGLALWMAYESNPFMVTLK